MSDNDMFRDLTLRLASGQPTDSPPSESDFFGNLTIRTVTGQASDPSADGDSSSQAASNVAVNEVASQLGFAPPGHNEIEDIQGAFRKFRALAGSTAETQLGADPKTVFETSHALNSVDSVYRLAHTVNDIILKFGEVETVMTLTIFNQKLTQRYLNLESAAYRHDDDDDDAYAEYHADWKEKLRGQREKALTLEVKCLAALYTNRQK